MFLLRMMEDLTCLNLHATLRFKIVNMTMADVLEMDISGTPIPMGQSVRTHWGRGRSYGTGRSLFPWVQFELPLTSPPARKGDNEIGFRVVGKASRISFDMTVEEIEVLVIGDW